MSAALDSILKLRPSSVASKLAGTRVCLLNARDIQRSVAETAATVIVCEVPAAPLAAGIVRAARQARAVLGLSVPAPPAGPGPRFHAIFQSLMTAVREADFELPFFLRAGPVLVPEASESAVSAARETVFRLVDAGFTEVCFDTGQLSSEDAAAVVAEASAALREREMSVEVSAGQRDPQRIAELVAALSSRGAVPDVVSVPATENLAQLAAAVAPATLAVHDPCATDAGMDARRLIASRRFCDIVATTLGRAAIPSELVGAPQDIASLENSDLLRIEALAYHEAFELFESTGAKGSAVTSVAFLSERNGY